MLGFLHVLHVGRMLLGFVTCVILFWMINCVLLLLFYVLYVIVVILMFMVAFYAFEFVCLGGVPRGG